MNRILILLSLILVAGCNDTTKLTKKESSESKTSTKDIRQSYPKNISMVFEAHGGLAAWQTKRTLSFTMMKEEGNETHTIDLKKRYEKIEASNFSMGFDGNNFWLADEKNMYKGDPIFYHNLMFYFYSMPFVLADNGIHYNEAENLEFEGKTYPGIRISYDDGVGVSSKDEYFLHYDPETNQMAWLGYTVTFRTGEKSDKVKWIRYADWQKVGRFTLPKSLTWYTVEDGKITEPQSNRAFDNIRLSDRENSDTFYSIPVDGKIVEKE